MNAQDLKHFSLKTGDIYALLDFCRKVGEKAPNTDRESLVEKLKPKLKEKNCDSKKKCAYGECQPSTSGTKGGGGGKGIKNTRMIEVGWLMNGTQVRSVNGGGTQRVTAAKDWTKKDILEKALALFFPNGNSPKGSVENFHINLLDFKKNEFSANLTVYDFFKITELSSIRFYLATQEKDEESQSQDEDSETTQKETPPAFPVGEDDVLYTINYEPDDRFEFQDLVHFNNAPTNVEEIFPEDTLQTHKLTLHCGHIFEEMLNAFKNDIPSINVLLEIQLLLPNGEKESAFDGGWVLRDSLSEFWESFYEMRCEGALVKRPKLRGEYREEHWQAIARILYVGYKQTSFFPSKLIRPFMEFTIFGRIHTDIMDHFLKLLGPTDALTIQKALENFRSVEQNELLDILQELECDLFVNENYFTSAIRDIAYKEIIQKAKFVIDSWNMKTKRNNGNVSILSEFPKLQLHGHKYSSTK